MSVIHPLRLRYSNAYLIVGARPILVDSGSRGDARRIAAGCAAAGVAIRDLALILHTHVHSDHFGNTADLATEAGCPVAYHPGDRPLAALGNNGPLRGVGLRGRILARLLHHLPFRTRAADIDAEDRLRLDEFGVAASVLHTPGHTPGSISVVLDSGDAIIGDVIMGGYAGGDGGLEVVVLTDESRDEFAPYVEEHGYTMPGSRPRNRSPVRADRPTCGPEARPRVNQEPDHR